jgi:hypothetical protein
LIGALLAGCAASADRPSRADPAMGPVEAIVRAAEAAPRPVPGWFAMTVRATGVDDGWTYLNSELDYRDQRNLSIAIAPAAARALALQYGAPPHPWFQGRTIRVAGRAERVKIAFTAGGRPTDKYYYQTHVRVYAADQIRVDR